MSILKSKNIIWMILLLWAIPEISNATQNVSAQNIIYFNSYHKGYKWSDDILKGIEDLFKKKSTDREYQLYVEYMDSKRFIGTNYYSSLLNLYRQKYLDRHIDLILCSDDNAFNFVKQHRQSIFPEVPIVFCGVNNFEAAQLRGQTNITGVKESAGIKETLNLILKLHPDTQKIVIINDSTTTGIKVNQEIEAILPDFKDRVAFDFFNDRKMEQILHDVAVLPSNIVIFYTVFFRDGEGRFFEYNDSISMIAAKSSVPIYGVWDFNLGFGMVGGMLTSGYFQGYTAAGQAVKILKGESINNLDIVMESPNKYMFDFNQLVKYGIDTKKLPPNSIVINKPKDFIYFYREYKIFLLSIVICFLAILSVLLLFMGLKMRYAKKKIQLSEEKYRAVFENTGTAMIIVDADTTISLANTQFSKMSGYSISEIEYGMSWEKFIPQKEDLDRMLKFHHQRRQTDSVPNNYEFTFIDRDNNQKQIFGTVALIKGTQKSVASLIDITQEKQLLKERENLINELQGAISKIRTLTGLLPICAFCKKIRNDEGYWQKLEKFFLDHSDTRFSHGVCPECMEKHYPE